MAIVTILLLFFHIGGNFLRVDKLSDHVISDLGLVCRHHMPSLVYSHKCEVFEVPDGATGCEECRRLPLVELLLNEFLLAIPDEGFGPIVTSSPIADVVLVAVVDQNGEASVE